jgi:hypothetical protein
VSGAWKVLRRLGGKLKTPRKSHAKKDQSKADAQSWPDIWAKWSARMSAGGAFRCSTNTVTGFCRSYAASGASAECACMRPYKWGYLHEAMEVDGRNTAEPLFTPATDQDTHALCLRRIAESAPEALHVFIQDRAGFNLPVDDSRLPPNLPRL